MRARPSRATWGSRDPGRATWVVRPRPRDLGCTIQATRPGLRDPGRASLGRTAQAARLAQPRPLDQGRASLGLFLLLRLFFFSSFWLWFLFLLVLFWYIWALNRVFKTQFLGGRHVENDTTSDVIRPWKSSPKDSIYGSKSSLLDSSC